MNLFLSPSQANAYQRIQNMRHFETSYENATHVLQGNYHQLLGELRNCEFKNNVFTAEYHFMRDVPNEEAIKEFEAFVQGWRDKGWNELADKISKQYDDEDTYPTTDILTKSVPDFKVIEIKDPKFYIYREATEEELQAERNERARILKNAPEGSYLTPKMMEKAKENLMRRANLQPTKDLDA